MKKQIYFLALFSVSQLFIAQQVISEENVDGQTNRQTVDESSVGTIPNGRTSGKTDDNLHPAYNLLLLKTLQPPIAQHVIFAENFDGQADWQTLDEDSMGTIPDGWTTGRTDENWHPTTTPAGQPSIFISGNDPDKVFGNTGKSLITYSESFNDTTNNGFTSDGMLTVDIAPVDEIYIEFKIKFQPGFAANSEGGQIKMFRILHFDGGQRYKFFSSGNSAPIYIFDWAQSPAYGVRQFHSFRCDDQENNYYCTHPTISGSPRNIYNGDMSANFVVDISQFPNTIPDLVNGGTIPTSGTIYHNQIYGDSWHKMSFYLHLNSAPGAKDGILKVWLDDHPITDMDQIPWIGTDGDMNAKWNSISFGGNDRYHFNTNPSADISERERWYAFDDILVLDTLPVGDGDN